MNLYGSENYQIEIAFKYYYSLVTCAETNGIKY